MGPTPISSPYRIKSKLSLKPLQKLQYLQCLNLNIIVSRKIKYNIKFISFNSLFYVNGLLFL